jgi:hypothetical protein
MVGGIIRMLYEVEVIRLIYLVIAIEGPKVVFKNLILTFSLAVRL